MPKIVKMKKSDFLKKVKEHVSKKKESPTKLYMPPATLSGVTVKFIFAKTYEVALKPEDLSYSKKTLKVSSKAKVTDSDPSKTYYFSFCAPLLKQLATEKIFTGKTDKERLEALETYLKNIRDDKVIFEIAAKTDLNLMETHIAANSDEQSSVSYSESMVEDARIGDTRARQSESESFQETDASQKAAPYSVLEGYERKIEEQELIIKGLWGKVESHARQAEKVKGKLKIERLKAKEASLKLEASQADSKGLKQKLEKAQQEIPKPASQPALNKPSEKKHGLESFPDLEAAKRESRNAIRGEVGPRKIFGWTLQDVDDEGNCFYDAIGHQMGLIGHKFLKSVPEGTLPRDSLRLLIQGTSFRDEEWADDRHIDSFVQKVNDVILAIVDTRNPQAGYVHYYAEGGNVVTHVQDDETPLPKRPLIRLAATGNHFLSVISGNTEGSDESAPHSKPAPKGRPRKVVGLEEEEAKAVLEDEEESEGEDIPYGDEINDLIGELDDQEIEASTHLSEIITQWVNRVAWSRNEPVTLKLYNSEDGTYEEQTVSRYSAIAKLEREKAAHLVTSDTPWPREDALAKLQSEGYEVDLKCYALYQEFPKELKQFALLFAFWEMAHHNRFYREAVKAVLNGGKVPDSLGMADDTRVDGDPTDAKLRLLHYADATRILMGHYGYIARNLLETPLFVTQDENEARFKGTGKEGIDIYRTTAESAVFA